MKKMIVICLSAFVILTACQASTTPGLASTAKQTITETEAETPEEKVARLEKERIEAEKKAAEEEAQKKAAEEARLKALRERTYFAKKDTAVYSDATFETATESAYQSRDKILTSETVKDEAGTVIGYKIESVNDAPKAGYVKADAVEKELAAFIAMPYENVDYSYFKRRTFEDNPPVKVRGIYVTQHTARNEARMDELIKIANETDLNAFVIDVKEDNGNLLFYSDAANDVLPELNEKVAIKDIDAFVKKMKDNNIYLIARVVAFKSPKYAAKYPERALMFKNGQAYRQGDGIAWSSAYDRQLWNYIIGVSKEAAAKGFNEIQFDYVRFPEMKQSTAKAIDFHNELNENQAQTIQNFLRTAYKELEDSHVYITADVFGWVGTAINDVGIGQHWEAVSNSVDYMAPMIYPSHYGKNNYGITYPDTKPYETINATIQAILERDSNLESPAILRPWIQDFTASYLINILGPNSYIQYGVDEVKAQIKALKDNGVDEFMLWNAANVYHMDALKKEGE